MDCKNCDGQGWVCESHETQPWAGVSDREDACNCEGVGVPCPICNLTFGEDDPPRMPGEKYN